LYQECLAGAEIIFPESGRGLRHVTLQFWHMIEQLQNCLSYRDFKFDTRFCMGNAEQVGLYK